MDIIRRIAKDADPHPLRMTDDENDLWAVQVSSGEAMPSSQIFEQMVVSVSGEMAMMRTLDPMAFVRVEKKLAQSPKRDPAKRPKDRLQADIVKYLWDECLVHRTRLWSCPTVGNVRRVVLQTRRAGRAKLQHHPKEIPP